MIRRLGNLFGTARRRRLAVWTVAGLMVASLGLALATRLAWPAVEREAAEQALGRDDPVRARAYLDRCLARWPADERALFLAAQAARRSGAVADAERYLTLHEQASGATTASRLEWDLLGAQQGDLAGEEDGLRSKVEHDRADAPLILEALAKGYSVSYRLPEAAQVLNQLLDLRPGHVPALVLRGSILDRLRQTDAAERDLRRAVDLAPESAAAHAALAGLLNRRGYPREAIRHYDDTQRLGVTDSATLLGLARAYTDAADLDKAQQRLDELVASDPDNADGLVERARLALRRASPTEAEPFLARAALAAPWHRTGQRLYLGVLKEMGQSEAAARCEAHGAELTAEDAVGGRLKLHARDTPSDAGVRWNLWLWSLRNGQAEEGLAWLAALLRLEPHNAQAHAAMADYFERAGQPRRAAQHRLAAAAH
jgi:Tfp pilus assembly protein PilF